MARPDKAAAVAELAEQFSNSAAAVLTEYRGLTVKDLKALRRSLGEDATYAVTKNTLTIIAARQAGIDGLDDQLAGPTAITFIRGDVATVAKGLRDFAKANPALVIKGGILDGKQLEPKDIAQLASLESREVLLAKLAGAMKGNLSKAAGLFAAPASQLARLAAALQEKKPADAPAAAEAPVAEAPAATEAPADAEAPADTAEAPAEAAE